jgi:riboflavin kinase / FMN adenylyltransferase
MQVFHKLEDVPADFGPTLVSVGNFDGVHRAHRFVLSEIVKRAKGLKAKSMAVTFEPHPTRILQFQIAHADTGKIAAASRDWS